MWEKIRDARPLIEEAGFRSAPFRGLGLGFRTARPGTASTAFATCPVQDTHCREVHEMMAIDALRRMVDRQESEIGGEDGPIC